MAAAEYYSGACMEPRSPHFLAPNVLPRAQTEQIGQRTEDVGIVQGCIMWLPSMEDLPERAVRRAHGKGAVEEGIYNHPIVVVSRPLDDAQAVHFHLITSLQGKRLDQLYPKANEFHVSRRSWYLPISPSPDHPDANSKKAKKRFPTLALAEGATLRWDSYVNIRHIYKIDWTLLKPYANLNDPGRTLFRLERESTVRMIAKGKVLTLYEPGAQMPVPAMRRESTAPARLPSDSTCNVERDMRGLCLSDSDGESAASPTATRTPTTTPGSDFRTLSGDGNQSTKQPPGEPPDLKLKRSFLGRVLRRIFQRRREG